MTEIMFFRRHILPLTPGGLLMEATVSVRCWPWALFANYPLPTTTAVIVASNTGISRAAALGSLDLAV